MAADYGTISSINWASPTETIIRASNPDSNDQFGMSVAISGNYAIVGAQGEDGSNNNLDAYGAAYIFENDGSGNWAEKKLLRASNGGFEHLFGRSVAISGNYAIVGAIQEDGSSASTTFNCGAAYIFERDGSGNWIEKQILRASNLGAGDQFGTSVAISGNYAIVGAVFEDGPSNGTADSGAAYIFERSDSTPTGVWSEKAILRASNLDAGDQFSGCAISGNYAVVTANQEDGSSASATFNCGAAYIFERDGSGNWIEKQILRASNFGANDYLGACAISGNYLILGTRYEDGSSNNITDCGAAYIFERSDSTPTGVWSEKAILRASNLGANDEFGASVAINGNHAIVGANREDGTSTSTTFNCGLAYIFERSTTGVWSEIRTLRASNADGGDLFGSAVAISDNFVIVGAYAESGIINNAVFTGAAYIYSGSIVTLNPTPLTFNGNTLTIANNISAIDTDKVSFVLSTGATLYPIAVNTFTGTGTIAYTLDISGGSNVVSGTFTAANFDILKGSVLTASGNTTYILTLTSNAAITYTIVASLLTAPTNILLSTNSINELKPIGTTIGTLTCDNPNNAFIVYSVSDSTNFSVSGFALKTNAIFDYEVTASYPITITASIGGLTQTNTFAIAVTNVSNEAVELRNQNIQGPALILAANSQTPPISATDLKVVGYTATEMKAAGYTATVLKEAAYTATEMKEAAYTATELKIVGYNATELKAALYNATEMKAAGYTASALKEVAYTATEMKAAGYTATELKAADYTITELKTFGYNVYEMTAAGYTAQQLNDIGYYGTDLSANRFNASYIEGYLDISGGNVTVRGSSRNLNMASGNAVFSGTTTFTQPYIYNNDISLNNRLFVIGDVSMGSGNANITGNLSINGTLSAGSYNTGVIALNAIYPAFATDMSYNQKIQMNGDVYMNGNTQFSGSTTLTVGNQIRFSDGTIIRTTNKEANGTTFKASTFNNMIVVGDFASNPVLTPSDYRIKTNVQSLDETHSLDNLRPVKYYQTQSERNDIGFLAHELQEYYPDLVEGKMDGEQMQSVNYNGILALLVNEVQRLKQNIKQTKAAFAAKKTSI